MFKNSVALIGTHDKSWFAHLHDLVLQAGFKEARPFPRHGSALTKYRRGPLPFIFVHAGLDFVDIQHLFATVRAHAELPIRFLPIIMLTESGNVQSIIRFVQMGSDDIISLPLTAGALIERLRHQVRRPRDYYQTESYFGPDRRQRLPRNGATQHEDRGKGTHFFRHFSIERHPQRGISILSSEVHYPDDPAPAQATG